MTNTTPEQPALPPQPAQPPATPAPAKKKLSPLTAGILGLAVGAGIVGGAWAISANSSSEPDTFTLEGTFSLLEDAIDVGDSCGGRYDSGYDDIQEGTSVTVYGAAGDVVATGHLANGEKSLGTCTFDVAVEGVPKGEKFYKVEVAHRGTVQVTAEEAENGEFAASLG
ncbi:hypothetical protein [Streptomyces sp. TRM75561]|uniref:hypothetical protein n=1 Tax=Streptomyces sp. TRM75561 TaxID=2975269 RepID=UPI00244A3B16|nr:hypothetical protein [Streptomyces sp. TRM75561]MDH3037905.1 hypothetical protein [Streptomyces sp. TRM75561]